MSIMEINSHELTAKMNRVAQAMDDTSPLMAAIAGSLATVTDDNFASQGRPTWAGRKPSTIKSYQRQGLTYGGVLQRSGDLRARIVPSSDQNSASIGSNMPYAAIHQFGGTIKHPGGTRYQKGSRLASFTKNSFTGPTSGVTGAHDIKIEARPYLPMDANGFLQPEAENEIFKDVDFYWKKIF